MDQITQLRQLIRESIQEYIREVETSGNVAAQEAKIRACEEAIALREKKINMEGLDEAYHDMIDETKKKGLEKEIKELQKYKAKTEKLLEKMKAKAAPKKMEDESVEETAIVDEVTLDENDPEAGPQLEGDALDEAKKKKMTAAQKDKKEDIVKGMKKSNGFGKSKEEKSKMYATATKLATDESLNEQFLYMQKLAGLITEAEYAVKKKVLSEEKIPFFHLKQVTTPFGIDKPKADQMADLRVGLIVLPKMAYKNESDVKAQLGKITKIEGDNVTVKKVNGEEENRKISDLIHLVDGGYSF